MVEGQIDQTYHHAVVQRMKKIGARTGVVCLLNCRCMRLFSLFVWNHHGTWSWHHWNMYKLLEILNGALAPWIMMTYARASMHVHGVHVYMGLRPPFVEFMWCFHGHACSVKMFAQCGICWAFDRRMQYICVITGGVTVGSLSQQETAIEFTHWLHPRARYVSTLVWIPKQKKKEALKIDLKPWGCFASVFPIK